MIVPQFIRFYGYTLNQTMSEFAVSFFSLVNSMYRIEANERLNGILEVSAGMAGKEAREVIGKLEDQSQGANKYIDQAKVLKGIRK